VSAAKEIISSALEARTMSDIEQLHALIQGDIGQHERPVGDRSNNFSLFSTHGLKEYKLVELVTNGQDAVLERFAIPKFGTSDEAPYATPHEAASDLLGSMRRDEIADLVRVELFESDPPTRKSKQMTAVVSDVGCGIAPADLSQTILFLGSDHKDKAPWQQGAFGLGGASTFRHAQAVVIVSRRHPDLGPAEDRIGVVVCQWVEHDKGKGLYYPTTTEWDRRTNPDAEPWSAPASAYPEFTGTQISLISYEIDSYSFLTHGAERSFERMSNTRLYEPVTPISFVNHIAKDASVRRIHGLQRQFEERPRKDRRKYEESMPFRINGSTYHLPITCFYFDAKREDAGARRHSVAKDHAVLFTSNGQVHEHWSPSDLKNRTDLKHINDRLLVIVDLNELPIKVRTNLFAPDRAGFMDTELAAKLEAGLVEFLNDPEGELYELDREQLRKAIVGERNGRPTINIARQIGRALKFKGGFSLTGGGGGGGGHKKRRKKQAKPDLYPDPTTLEGPGSIQIEQAATRGVRFHVNARDEFLASGRGRLEVTCTHPDVGEREITIGELRKGSVRATIALAEGAELGNYELLASIRGWGKASGGIGPDLEWRTTLKVIEPKEKQPPKPGKDNAGDDGDLVGLAWRGENDFDDWHGGTPGHVEPVPASMLAEESEDYKDLEPLGDTKVPTIFLNRDYTPLKKYEGARANDLTEKGLEDARDRYAVGAGLGLLLLDQDLKAKANGSGVPEGMELTAKQAAAQSALVMMPQYDRLAKEAGVED
jgi:hypothetical protein